MRSYKLGKVCFGVSLAIMMSLGISYAANLEENFNNGLKNIAKYNLNSSRFITENGKKVSVTAYGSDSNAVDSFQRMLVSEVSTASDIDEAIEQLKIFGVKVSNTAEKEAFDQGLNLLEKRVKFLSQTENPKLADKLGEFSNIRSEFEEFHQNISDDQTELDEASLIKASQSRSTTTNRRTSTTNRTSSANRTATTNKSKKTATPKPSVRVKREVSTSKLGAYVANGKTSFAVYSPEATEVKLYLFAKPTDKTGKAFAMKKGPDGVWKASVDGELYGTYYGFTADGPKGPGYLFDKTRLLSDPYAFANYNHNGKSIVVDRNYNWKCKSFKRPAAKDAVIYEMHVKDFTAHKSSGVKEPYKGKYLGLLQGKGTSKVLGHLKELGVNTIELMPVHEYDNDFAGHPNHWGYMTTHFFAPESAYASGANGQGVKELKAAIDGLHSEGFAVILDVVFNHTAEGNEQGTPINFKGFDNAGYYRLMPNDKNYYWNGTGCGNEMHTESPMCRKMILDSLKYWMSEYKVDGFRFDLGTIIDKGTMQAIIDELPSSTILTSEPWAADWQRNQWAKADFRNSKLAKWNDDFRENVRSLAGGNVNRNNLMTVLAGSCFWWAAKPAESLNYIEAHDGYTINDLFKGDKKRQRIAAIALLTAQGIPMLHAGQEFGRSKGGNENSYDQDNATNWIDWTTKEKNKDLFDLYKGLIALRMKYPNFRSPVAMNNQTMQWIQPGNQNALGMYLKGDTDFLVLFNGDNRDWVSFKLPQSGAWKVVCDGEKINDAGLYTAEGDYNVPPTTAIILKK